MSEGIEADIAALLASGEFDEKSYLEKYPDVKLLGMRPAEHFLWVGRRLGRTSKEHTARALPRLLEGVAQITLHEMLPGLTFNCDHLLVRHERFFLYGWAIHASEAIARVIVLAEQAGVTTEFIASFGNHREDVARDWGPAYANAGFACRGKLANRSPAAFSLRLEFRSGKSQVVRLHKPSPSHREARRKPVPANLVQSHTSAGKAVATAAQRCREIRSGLAIVFDHSLGGGANRYRRQMVEEFCRDGVPVLLVSDDVFSLELLARFQDGEGEHELCLDRLEDIFAFTDAMPVNEIVFNNAYSFNDPLGLIDFVAELKRRTNARMTFALHDYFSICPSYTLLNADGEYCGVPDPRACRDCLERHRGDFREFVDDVDLVGWRSRWARFLAQADKILCFSDSSAALLTKAHPQLDRARIEVRPHAVDYLPPQRPILKGEGPLHIGVCGTINEQKGIGVLKALAERIHERRLPYKITVFGSLSEALPESVVRVLGQYDTDALAGKIQSSGANVFLFPSIWPETFSYVTEELMQLGVPLAAFDLGAPAERLGRYPKGMILRSMEPEAILNDLEQLKARSYGAPTGSRSPAAKSAVHVFTSAAANYIPKVRLLCASIKQHHPEFVVHLALADKKPDWLDVSKEPFDSVIEVADLPIPNRRGWVFGHSIIELSTGIKPFVMRSLLSRPDVEKVFYFDPDMVLFSRVDDMVEVLSNANLVLTPHQTTPELEYMSIIDNEICSLKHGIFNLGFIGVRNTDEGRKFADWWAHRLYHFCREELHNGLWTDQKWIDHAPVFFEDVTILKSSRFNVAPWNLTMRHVSGDMENGFFVDGRPLGFYHFTGFDSGAHDIMAKKYAGHNSSVMGLVDWYRRRSAEVSDALIESTPWAFAAFENGEKISWEQRMVYRIRRDLQEVFPDPFHTGSEESQSYFNWFRWRAHEEHPQIIAFSEVRKEKAIEKTLHDAVPLVPFATCYSWSDNWSLQLSATD
jgi:glycosyltransferase involved in cell wall biosynthesis